MKMAWNIQQTSQEVFKDWWILHEIPCLECEQSDPWSLMPWFSTVYGGSVLS